MACCSLPLRLQMTLFDSDGDVVAKREGLESGGQTLDYETFYFDEPAQGSRIRLDVKGTTAGKGNHIAEVNEQQDYSVKFSCLPAKSVKPLFLSFICSPGTFD